jgi:hypothetical protein
MLSSRDSRGKVGYRSRNHLSMCWVVLIACAFGTFWVNKSIINIMRITSCCCYSEASCSLHTETASVLYCLCR